MLTPLRFQMLNENENYISIKPKDGLAKDALGDVLLQDRFQVWDSKQLIKKGKERHVFLFETSIVFAKEIKDTRDKLKYVYKFKLMVGFLY
jgi:hypothetical protein